MTSAKRRIAIFLPSLAGGGAERVMLNVAHGLAKDPHLSIDLVLADFSGAYAGSVGTEVNLIDLGAGRISRSPAPLRRYLRKQQPEAIISALDLANLTLIAVGRSLQHRPRILVTEHNALSVKLEVNPAATPPLRLFQRILPSLIGSVYRLADQVLAVSEGVADDLSETTGLPRQKISIVGNPVITPDVRERACLPPVHPWLVDGEGPPVFLGVGRLSSQKNFPLLIRAFAQVRAGRECRLVILGEGPDRDQLEALAEELGVAHDVSLPGFVDNPYAEMSAASVFVLSSRHEGLPTVLIESLYCDTPVVSTDCKAGPRQILEDGKHGELVPVDDVSALATAMEKALVTSRTGHCQTGWEDFTEEQIIAQYRTIVDKTVGRPTAPLG